MWIFHLFFFCDLVIMSKDDTIITSREAAKSQDYSHFIFCNVPRPKKKRKKTKKSYCAPSIWLMIFGPKLFYGSGVCQEVCLLGSLQKFKQVVENHHPFSTMLMLQNLHCTACSELKLAYTGRFCNILKQ